MSRCFPYPPPGYVRGETSLAESIKLQKVKEQEKERKKDKKREHKEKKDKKRSRDINTHPTDEKQFQKKRRIDREAKLEQKVQFQQDDKVKFLPDQKLQFLPDGKVQLFPEEQLEKSGLTEELGQPHQPYQCGSPDSSASEDSSKRRRIGDNQKAQATQATGLRIRLAFSKPNTTEVAPVASLNILRLPVPAPPASRLAVPPSSTRQPPSSPVRASALNVDKEHEAVPRPSTSKIKDAFQASERPSFSRRTEASTSGQLTTSDVSGLLDGGYSGSKKSRKREAKFNDLFLGWVPPQLLEPPGLDVEGQDDWLFNTSRQQRRQAQIDTGACLDLSAEDSIADSLCSWPPRARHLQDADVYALPYVVPF